MPSETQKLADPCVMIIFGATGDLTKRKLFPSLYYLAKGGFLSDQFAIVAVGRQELTTEEYKTQIISDLKGFVGDDADPDLISWFEERTHYTGGDFDDDKALFSDIKDLLDKITSERKIPRNFFYYMAIPPSLFAVAAEKIAENGLAEESGGCWRRFIFEKPFGRDLESAKSLNSDLLAILDETQIYRIDHYLGKETVQNILVFRFGNSIFEPIWNRNYVDHIQITVAEDLGVGTRGGYYDNAGALRDMVPNHIFQLVTLTAMEPPVSFDPNAVRNEQAKILGAIKPFTPENVLDRTARGQYGSGNVNNESVPSYRELKGIKPGSDTETYAALRLCIDNWRWAGVPFYIRTGKRLPKKHTTVMIQFKKAPFMLFQGTDVQELTSNRIVLHIQPDEGINLHFGAKTPGPLVRMSPVDMDFDYSEHFGEASSTGYERLLFDCMVGDATLFQRADMVEASWRIVSPILDVWNAIPARGFPNYEAGAWGPDEADKLLERDGRSWKNDID